MARHRVAAPISVGAGVLAVLLIQLALTYVPPGVVVWTAGGVVAVGVWFLMADRG